MPLNYDKKTYTPNYSYFFNLFTQRMHQGLLDSELALESPGKEISPLTFHLVQKEWVMDHPSQEPTRYYNALDYPTVQTAVLLAGLVRGVVGQTIQLSITGNVVNPTQKDDAPFVVVTNSEGAAALIHMGTIAYYHVSGGKQRAEEQIKITLKDQGFQVV